MTYTEIDYQASAVHIVVPEKASERNAQSGSDDISKELHSKRFEFRTFKSLDRHRNQLRHRLEICRPTAGNQAFEIPCKNSPAA